VDPVISRVAARYARRTIRFDTRAVSLLGSELAERAVNKLVKTLPPDSGIEWELARHSTIVEDVVELPDVRGRAKTIAVRVKHHRLPNNRPTAGGQFSPEDDEIVLYLNSEWHPAAFQAVLHDLQTTFASFLVHEVTHALDVLPSGGSSELFEEAPAKYYNLPAEFRAFTKQIVVDVLRSWRMTLRRNPGKSGAPLVEAALESSPNYAKVREHFDRRNQQRLRQTVVRELQDAGLMPA
jgi:hypothetical protein